MLQALWNAVESRFTGRFVCSSVYIFTFWSFLVLFSLFSPYTVHYRFEEWLKFICSSVTYKSNRYESCHLNGTFEVFWSFLVFFVVLLVLDYRFEKWVKSICSSVTYRKLKVMGTKAVILMVVLCVLKEAIYGRYQGLGTLYLSHEGLTFLIIFQSEVIKIAKYLFLVDYMNLSWECWY